MGLNILTMSVVTHMVLFRFSQTKIQKFIIIMKYKFVKRKYSCNFAVIYN